MQTHLWATYIFLDSNVTGAINTARSAALLLPPDLTRDLQLLPGHLTGIILHDIFCL